MLQQILGNLSLEKEEAIVLVFVDGQCEAGLSGEERPRCVVAVPVDEACQDASALDAALEPFLRRLTLSRLQAQLSERRCLVCFPVTTPEAFRAAVVRVLLRKSPAVAVVATAVALIPLGLSTALLVERGPTETRVVPIVHGAAAVSALTFAAPADGSPGLAAAVARAVRAAPVDARLPLVRSVVAGAGPLLPADVAAIAAALPAGLQPHVAAAINPFGDAGANRLVWCGAAIVASTLHKRDSGLTLLKRGDAVRQLGQLG